MEDRAALARTIFTVTKERAALRKAHAGDPHSPLNRSRKPGLHCAPEDAKASLALLGCTPLFGVSGRTLLLPRGRKSCRTEAEMFSAPGTVEAGNARDQHPLDPSSRDHRLVSAWSPGWFQNLSLRSTAVDFPHWLLRPCGCRGWGPQASTSVAQGCCGLCTAEGLAAPGLVR